MDIHEKLILEDCPYCGNAGLLEEENGWCWFVTCNHCGSQTAPIEYKKPEDREKAAAQAAKLWNNGKVVRADLSE